MQPPSLQLRCQWPVTLLVVLAALAGAGLTFVAAEPSPLVVRRRPACLHEGLGVWAEQKSGDASLGPAELDYSAIRLAAPGSERLARLGGNGWPVVLGGAAAQRCACCRLCSAQNELPTAGQPRCRRWSHRARDGACRLWGPVGDTTTPVFRQNAVVADQVWFSGSSEGYVPLLAAEPKGQCVVLMYGGMATDGMGGSVQSLTNLPPPPPPKRPQRSPPPPRASQRRPPPPRSKRGRRLL